MIGPMLALLKLCAGRMKVYYNTLSAFVYIHGEFHNKK